VGELRGPPPTPQMQSSHYGATQGADKWKQHTTIDGIDPTFPDTWDLMPMALSPLSSFWSLSSHSDDDGPDRDGDDGVQWGDSAVCTPSFFIVELTVGLKLTWFIATNRRRRSPPCGCDGQVRDSDAWSGSAAVAPEEVVGWGFGAGECAWEKHQNLGGEDEEGFGPRGDSMKTSSADCYSVSFAWRELAIGCSGRTRHTGFGKYPGIGLGIDLDSAMK